MSQETSPDPDVLRPDGSLRYHTDISIQDAIDHAKTGDTIRLENGATFYEHDLTIPGGITSLTFDVWNAYHTGPGGYATIDAQQSGRILTINPGVTVNISNLTIQNGNADDGGAIYNEGNLTVNNSTFTGNTANDDGGAILNEGSCTISGCTLTNNTADDGGGAILNDGTCTISGCTLTNNTAEDYRGGGIWNWDTLTITSSTIQQNIAPMVVEYLTMVI